MQAPLQHRAFADHIANNGETSLSVALACRKHDVFELLRYFTKPTLEHSVTMAIVMRKEIGDIFRFFLFSIIVILEMRVFCKRVFIVGIMGLQEG